MEYFIGNPKAVRGLGNILLDKKVLDLREYYSQVETSTDTVNETLTPIYVMDFLDDEEDDMQLPYDVNALLNNAVYNVEVVSQSSERTDRKLDVIKYEEADLGITTLRQLKHALAGKVKSVNLNNGVLTVVRFERSDLMGLDTKAAVVSLLTGAVCDVSITDYGLSVAAWSAADVENGITEIIEEEGE